MPYKPLSLKIYEKYIESVGWRLRRGKWTGIYIMTMSLFVLLLFLMENEQNLK